MTNHGTFELGPTGSYPDGTMHELDSGEITMAVGIVDGRIVLEFGKDVKWLGLRPQDALNLADLLTVKVSQLDPAVRVAGPAITESMREKQMSLLITQLNVLIGLFQGQVNETQDQAMTASDVVHMASYAAMAKTWNDAIGMVEDLIRDEAEPDEEWEETDEIDFGKLDIEEPRKATPEEIEQMGLQSVGKD